MKKKAIIGVLMAALAITGCGAQEAESDALYQVNLLQSLTAGGYDGAISVKELKEHGNTGIGTFEGVNGEMIVLDGTVYQALWDGSVVEADDEETVPYATVTYMDEDVKVDSVTASDIDDLKTKLTEYVQEQGANQIYMIELTCSCDSIYVRSELKQEKPYRPLNEALAEDQREFNYDNATGTIVGLYTPAYLGQVNGVGWHFHFVSDDRTEGGHVLDLTNLTGSLVMDQIQEFDMWVEDTDDFNAMDLSEDQSQRIHSVEQDKK